MRLPILGITATGLLLSLAAHADAPPARTPALLEKGKSNYQALCVACHGDKGEGNGVAAAALTPKPRNFKAEQFKFGGKLGDVFQTIGRGSPGTAMAPFALSDEDRWSLAYYVLSLRGETGEEAKDVSAAPKGKHKKH